MQGPSLKVVRVTARAGLRTLGWLVAGSSRYRVALGRSGIRADKREGDGATPRGVFRPVQLWWRADRGVRPGTALRVRRIERFDAWCEDPRDRRYNRPIRLQPSAAGDRLWRDDHLYDLIVEIDHNARPRVAGRGSAVFIHLARRGLAPTAGCVALEPASLRRLVTRFGPNTRIIIQ
jgi:L,D-peptidoglycan transpeptidase YkuD (ErfK/YbiS/YcfS/YnhG family)